MILPVILLVNNIGLFILEILGYHVCHSVVMLLDGYYRLCQAILCAVRIVSRLVSQLRKFDLLLLFLIVLNLRMMSNFELTFFCTSMRKLLMIIH